MAKMRVYELARRYQLSSKGLIELLRGLDIEIDHHFVCLDEREVVAARQLLHRIKLRQEPLVFFCYSTKDLELMRGLRTSLESAGFTIWTAEGIKPGTSSWMRAIKQAIRRSRAVVAILSKDAERSDWVEKELIYSRQLNRPIIPILAKDEHTEATPFIIVNVQWVDARGKEYSSGVASLIQTLRERGVMPSDT